MTSVFIVYHSATGTTAKLAAAVREGASELATATLFEIKGKHIIEGRFQHSEIWAELEQADAIIFGSPTYMGGPSAQFKAFADATSDGWSRKMWADKLAAGFTIGSSLNGDQFSTLSYFSVLAAQHGMLWRGLDTSSAFDSLGRNRLGTMLGLAAHSEEGQLHGTDLVTAHYLGREVARMAARLALSRAI